MHGLFTLCVYEVNFDTAAVCMGGCYQRENDEAARHSELKECKFI